MLTLPQFITTVFSVLINTFFETTALNYPTMELPLNVSYGGAMRNYFILPEFELTLLVTFPLEKMDILN